MENNQAIIRVEETAQGASEQNDQVGIRWPEAKRTSAGTAQGTSLENNQANNRGQEVKRIQWGSSSGDICGKQSRGQPLVRGREDICG